MKRRLLPPFVLLLTLVATIAFAGAGDSKAKAAGGSAAKQPVNFPQFSSVVARVVAAISRSRSWVPGPRSGNRGYKITAA
jgi:hypothetical protein